MKILITGSRGMLGQDLMKVLEDQHQVIGYDIEEIDIGDEEQCLERIGDLSPDWIVNSAAYTDVDGCETNQVLASKINGQGPGNLAKAAAVVDARLIQISTDYVFQGQNSAPYLETDPTNPQTVYGKTKLEGENNILTLLPDKGLIVRTSWLFGLNGNNFIETILNVASQGKDLRIVNDQYGSPTSTVDLSRGICELIKHKVSGTVNVTNVGTTTWFEFARYFLSKKYPEISLTPVSSMEYQRPARRPAYSVLSSEKLKSIIGNSLPDWQDAVDRYLIDRALKLKEKSK